MFHPNLAEPTTVLLKSQTAQTHASLESLLLPHLQTIGTPAGYAAILKVFYGYFQPLENAVAPYINRIDLADFRQRRKAHFLINDLASLGIETSELTTATRLPRIATKEEAFGALYVMEGSTLGGRGITRMLRKSLPLLTIDSFSFFNGYGEGTGYMWTAFQQTLNNIATGEAAQRQVVAAANETFIKFGQWIQQTI